MKTNEEIKEIVKRFKSKNGIGLLAYRGVWKGASGDKPIKYIEVEDTREFIDSFIENESEREYSIDKLLKDVVKDLENTFILKNFRVRDFRGKQYLFDGDGTIDEIVRELKLLIEAKERIEFNEDFGVGRLYYEKGKYLIELNVYCNMSFPVGTKNLKEIAKWLKEFHSGESNFGEPYNDGKAMSVAFMKDSEDKKTREQKIKEIDKNILKALRTIK